MTLKRFKGLGGLRVVPGSIDPGPVAWPMCAEVRKRGAVGILVLASGPPFRRSAAHMLGRHRILGKG